VIITLQHWLVLAVLLFAIGAAGAVVRRNVLMIFIAIEIMFAAAGVALAAFARWNLLPEGQAAILFLLAVMAAEAAVGLSLIVALARRVQTTNADELKRLRG
jgi:NADH-quinone oxidoreductase subunit K